MSYRIKRRDLKPYVLQWLSTKLELGLGIGKILYLATSGGEYEANLLDAGVPSSEIFSSLVAAEDDLTANKNDVLCVTPGLYTETATTDWDKDHTHLVGLAGPNTLQRAAHANCMLYTDTAGVDFTIHLTGDFCQFHNIMLGNGKSGGSANATNYAPLKVAGYGNYFKRVGCQGLGTTAQSGAYLCSALEISDGAAELMFEDCMIGGNTYLVARTITGWGESGQGVLRLSTTGAGAANVEFKDTTFISRSGTAACVMVHTTNQNATDRMWNFKRCHFDNFCDNWTTMCTDVFGSGSVSHQTTNVNLIDCTARGYSYWAYSNAQATVKWIYANGPASAHQAGIMYIQSSTS